MRLRQLAATTVLLLCAAVGAWGLRSDWGRLMTYGSTSCLPGLGTRVWIRPGLSPAADRETRIHEARHVRQIAERGCGAIMLAGWSRAGVLQLEAEAMCAEAAWRRGQRHGWDETAIAREDVWEGYPYVHPLGRARVRQVVAVACRKG